MSDGGRYLDFENVLNIEAKFPTTGKNQLQDVAAARKALTDAIHQIPEASLRGLKGFRLTVMA